MSDGYKVIKLFSGYAIVYGHSLIDITSDKRGGLYVSEDEARTALRTHLRHIEEGE